MTSNKSARKNPNMARQHSTLNPDSDMMKKRLEFALECRATPKVDFADAEAIRERINWYFGECIKRGIRPGVEGMCNALHTRKQELSKWANGVRRAGQGHQEVILEAKQVLADMMEQYMLNGEINPVAGIFLSSNQFDYDRNATVTLQASPQLISEEDPKRLADKYKADAIDVDAAEPVKLLADGGSEE